MSPGLDVVWKSVLGNQGGPKVFRVYRFIWGSYRVYGVCRVYSYRAYRVDGVLRVYRVYGILGL